MSTPQKPMAPAICAAIRQVPRGRVSTYGAIAKAAGFPGYSRYVARVLNQVRGLPWQRIVAAGGRIALKGEAAMEQRFLLESEGVRFKGKRVDMREYEHKFAIKRSETAAKPPKTKWPPRK